MMTLPRLKPAALKAPRRLAIPPEITRRAAEIVDAVRRGGAETVRSLAAEFDGLTEDRPLLYERAELERALDAAPAQARRRLERIAGRIRRFAEAQLSCLSPLSTEIPGGWAGHRLSPLAAAGCYAPGGRYPLPSSALMTAIPARVAGVETVWVASPQPAPVTLWAAAEAGADGLLAAGGAQAIAALAFGVADVGPADIVVGPGNLWVTAAKQCLAGEIAVDLPAGPSELLVITDSTSDPRHVAADLLAQAEHDALARPWLLATSHAILDAVDGELARQLSDLPTAATARAALAGGGAVLCGDEEEMVRLTNAVGPEHLQLAIERPERLAGRLKIFGSLFLGVETAEVFGDYGAGPNHVLPTGGAARHSGGLSVLDFVRLRTWMQGRPGKPDETLIEDTVWLARQEGLEAHARAAELRRPGLTVNRT